MKKPIQLLMLFVAVSLLSCNKDDDSTQAPANLFEVQIGGNYLNATTTSAHIFLSKPDGSLIEGKPFSNSTSIVFENTENMTDPFWVTIVEGSSYFLTYLDVPAGSSWFLDRPVFNNGPTVYNSVLTIENTGSVASSPFYVSSGNRSGFGLDYSNNNMELIVNYRENEPTSALAIYKSNDDNQVRYAFQEAIQPGSSTTLSHTSLPVIENPTIVELPSIPIGYFSIKGDPIGSDNLLLDVSSVENGSGTTSHYVPEGIFEKLVARADGYLSANEYFTVETHGTTLPQSINLPSFVFNAAATPNGFSATSDPGFDVFGICLNNAAQNLTWCVVSERKSDFTFTIPTVPAGIINGSLDLTGLKVASVNVSNFEPFDSYGQHLSQLFSNNGLSYEMAEYVQRVP